MNPITRILWYLSKTDRDLIVLCFDSSYKTQTAYGGFVLIVGLFAFSSASYALRTTFGASKLVYLIALFYAVLIMLIDREIVSANHKSALMIATRLLLATFIGLVVSVPPQEVKRVLLTARTSARIFPPNYVSGLPTHKGTSFTTSVSRWQQLHNSYNELGGNRATRHCSSSS